MNTSWFLWTQISVPTQSATTKIDRSALEKMTLVEVQYFSILIISSFYMKLIFPT